MTTDALLMELRELYNEFQDGDMGEEAAHIINIFDHLDNLIVSGSPLPREWQQKHYLNCVKWDNPTAPCNCKG